MGSDKLRELLNEAFEDLEGNLPKLQRLVSFYRQIYGKNTTCIGCGGKEKLINIYNTLKKEGLNIMEKQEKSEFLLKDNVSGIPLEFGSTTFLSVSTLTDELAIKFLSKNKNRIQLFKKYPANWEELVSGTIPVVTIPDLELELTPKEVVEIITDVVETTTTEPIKKVKSKKKK